MAKFLIALMAGLLILCRCKQLDIHQVRAVHIEGNIPAILPDTSYTISNAYDIFYYDNLTMYKFEYRFDSLVNGKLLLQESRPNFFVFSNDSVFGYSYYPHSDSKSIEGRIAVDTMFKRNAYEPFKFDSTFHYKPDSLFFDRE